MNKIKENSLFTIETVMKERAQKVYTELQEGGDFNSLASMHSDDTYNAQNGGDLGWFGRGAMVPEFEQLAFSLGVGEIGGPLKTKFGYHIIKVDEVKSEESEEDKEVKARHILFRFQTTQEYLDDKLENARIKNYIVDSEQE